MFDDRQPQTAAAGLTGTGFVDAIEPFGQARQVLRRNPRPIIANLELRTLPRVFACGEMLDWEAPTGGYLLTACWATGAAAGKAAAQV